MGSPLTLFQKVWNEHLVTQQPGAPAILFIDLHLVHEVTSPQAFSSLRARGLTVRRPDRTIATVDHGVPTLPSKDGTVEGRLAWADDLSRKQIAQLEDNAKTFAPAWHNIDIR